MNEELENETSFEHEEVNEESNQEAEEQIQELNDGGNEGLEDQDENNSDQGEQAEDDEASNNNASKVESEGENESDEEFAGFGEDEIKVTKKRQITSDDSAVENAEENDGDDDDEDDQPKRHRKPLNSDDEDNNEEQAVDNDYDNRNEEENQEVAEGEEDQLNGQNEEIANEQESDEEDFDRPVRKEKEHKPSDLDLMLAKNKAQKAKNRRKNKTDSEEINDWDNKISMIISEMKNVAAEDRAANEKSMMSLQKHKMLPTVVNMLQKTDFHATMIELGVLGAIAEWLAPLPDRSLPNIIIREFMIDTLRDFGEINADYLKSSGIGKAVMFLYKHSKETKVNKQKLERLINDWSRPIFSLDGNFKQLSREERLERDLEHVKLMNRREKEQAKQMDDLLDATETRKSKKAKKRAAENSASEEPKKFLRPGDVGFCPRARVPIPSTKDYVIRPKSNIEAAETEAAGSSRSKGGKKSESRMDKHKKRFEELRKHSKSNRAVTMVATGGK